VAYEPGYVVNAGGNVNVVAEFLGEPQDGVEGQMRAIAGRLKRILVQAMGEGRAAHELANEAARARIDRAAARSAA
jgi:leucine dehydrogenase